MFGGGKTYRLFFATDIHGSDRCFRKWINAAKAYGADMLILGGDVTGKLLVPIVAAADGTWYGQLHGRPVHAVTRGQLAELTQALATAGHYWSVVDEDRADELRADAAALDAVLDDCIRARAESWAQLAQERLRGHKARAYVLLGNDDPPFLADVFAQSSDLVYAEDRVVELPGGFEMLSFGPSTPTPWNTPRELSETEIAARLDGLAADVRDPARAVANIHCPPHGTHLDNAPKLDADLRPQMGPTGVVTTSVGSQAVRSFLERMQPALGLHGHVHESPGVQELGRTTCVNPGSDYTDGILRGALVTLHESKGVRGWQLVQG
jgi:Icc-related predicted phosphoesterase